MPTEWSRGEEKGRFRKMQRGQRELGGKGRTRAKSEATRAWKVWKAQIVVTREKAPRVVLNPRHAKMVFGRSENCRNRFALYAKRLGDLFLVTHAVISFANYLLNRNRVIRTSLSENFAIP
jgi:hypothetical protein